VRTGDTFYGLARHYGIAVELVQSANPGVDPRRIRIGMTLKVPVVGGVVREPPAESFAREVAYTGSYVVRSGDTLWAVSRRYGTTPELLAAANGRGLDELLQPGETLRVPGSGDPEARESAAGRPRAEAPGSEDPPGGSGE
jgi:membrane-bound lytic murein transglycosylase D